MLYTTKEPTDKELEVAKRAYKRLLELETGETYIYEKEFTSVKKMRLANEISNYHIDDDYIDDVIDNLIDEAYDQYIIEEVMLP